MGGQTRNCGSPAYRVKLPLRVLDLLDRKIEFGFAPFAAVFAAVQSATVRRACSTATGITSSNSDRSNSNRLSIV